MDNTTASNPTVRDFVEAFKAEVVGQDAAGVIDFYLGDIKGLAYKQQKTDTVRASFFIAPDPDPEQAEAWIAQQGALHDGELHLIKVKGGQVIRLLVERPLNEATIHAAWWQAQSVRALATAWETYGAGQHDLLTVLAQAGIACPPFPDTAVVNYYGPWSWGSTCLNPFIQYMFDIELVAKRLADHGPAYLLSHAGHGVNSYGLNLLTTSGPVAAFVQHGYGGAYADPVSDLVEINSTYARLHVLLETVGEVDEPLRWLMVYSQFRGSCGIIDLAKVREGDTVEDAIEAAASEVDLFRAMAAKFPSLAFRPAGGSIDWGTPCWRGPLVI